MTQDEMYQARMAPEMQKALITPAMKAEIERLHERLEDNHVFELVDGVMTRVAVEPGSIPDGIDCRDETIKLLHDQIYFFEAKLDKAEAENVMLKAKISNLEGQIAYRDGIAQL